MTKLQVIQLIGVVIRQIDNVIDDLPPGDPNQQRLQQQRDALDDQQRRLAIEVFNENDAAFQNATQQLQAANAGIQASLDRLDNIENTIATITQFVTSVTSLLTTVGALV